MRELIAAVNALGNVRLLVLDHIALIHGDFNAREDAALTMRVVNHIAQKTGASVLVLAHTPKAAKDAETSDASMVAGSTAFVDQARGAWVLATMREQEAKKLGLSNEERLQHASLSIVKNNYGPTGDTFWFRRFPFDGVGLLEHVCLVPPAPHLKSAASLETRSSKNSSKLVLRSFQRPGFADLKSGKDGPFKASKDEVARVIETLIADGRLVNRPPTK